MSTNMLVSNLFNVFVLYLNVFFFFHLLCKVQFFIRIMSVPTNDYIYQVFDKRLPISIFIFYSHLFFFSYVSVHINCLWWNLMILNTKNRSEATYAVRTFLIPTHYFLCFCLTATSANPIQLLRKGFASFLMSK